MKIVGLDAHKVLLIQIVCGLFGTINQFQQYEAISKIEQASRLIRSWSNCFALAKTKRPLTTYFISRRNLEN